MLVLKKHHYIVALLILAAVVCLAAYSGGRAAEPSDASPKSATPAPSAASATPEATSAAYAAAEPEPLVGVWVPYMSLQTAENTEEAFKANYDEKLRLAKESGANAVFVHVRPFADSLYPSDYGAWSHVLTGTQGEVPGYDPLAYMIEKSHEAGMAFHAWINPLRISTGSTPDTLSADSFYAQNAETNPSYFMTYDGGVYYNPASAYIRGRIADGAAEIAERYDVDGIHFDDYFYPTEDESIDQALYNAYKSDTEEPLALHEWRTANINALIATVYHRIKAANPDVVFGISPQGNLENNALINADVHTWMTQSGYIDYICPQLYFSFDNEALPFEDALESWISVDRADDVKLYIGLALYKAGTDADGGTWLNASDMIARQIARAMESKADGVVLYAVDYLATEEAQEETDNARAAIAALTAE